MVSKVHTWKFWNFKTTKSTNYLQHENLNFLVLRNGYPFRKKCKHCRKMLTHYILKTPRCQAKMIFLTTRSIRRTRSSLDWFTKCSFLLHIQKETLRNRGLIFLVLVSEYNTEQLCSYPRGVAASLNTTIHDASLNTCCFVKNSNILCFLNA